MKIKLVRDKIPLIIDNTPDTDFVQVNSKVLKMELLANKLLEETNEYLEEYELEELVDIATVISSILKLKEISPEEFKEAYDKKAEERGEFDNGIVGIFLN